jgi:diguanylate cyclase (GGDEF)-like protein/putative nucleotidyltransferase with HDIG domain
MRVVGMSRASAQTFRGYELQTDSKTGLFTSEFLTQGLEDALASAKRRGSTLSVVIVDLDQVCAINGRHGHRTGDKVIRAAAEVVSEVASIHRGIAARLGGDELCLLLPAKTLEAGRQIAEEVRARIDHIRLPLDDSGQVLAITASVGVASYPEHAPAVEGLLAAADFAVDDAKLEGRNLTRVARPPGVREALKGESRDLASQGRPSSLSHQVAEPTANGNSLDDDSVSLDEPAGPATRSRLVVSYAGALCIGALSAGAVLVGALSSAAIPNLLWLAAVLAGGLPLLTLWIAEKQYLGRWRPIVTDLRMSNDELEAANARLFGLLDENRQLLGRMQRSYLSTITSLARTAEANDPHTSGHTERVAEIALLLAGQLDLDESDLPAIKVGAIIHDIGKVGTPDQILSKPGALTPEETREIRKHPEIASQIIADLELPATVKQMVRSHHERFDGDGYPDGLIGEQIPLAARILSVAEALDAMTSDRPYRDAMPLEVACAEIRDKAGTQFCPRVVVALTKSLAESRSFWADFSGPAGDPESASISPR